MCSTSLFEDCWSLETTLALCANVLKTLCLAVRKWLLFQCRYWSVCVGFLYTVVLSVLLGPSVTLVSRNRKRPMLIWFLHCELYVWVLCVDVGKKLLLCSAFWMTKVSSTNLNHKWGLGAVLRTLTSNSSMKRFAMRGLME